ncbi:fibronectin type III domain-containing protein [Pelagicoccus albus]|uniref:Fibronectin type III domain-containing protein n=1 Tax=Pelagicoccus albus TaxID=415222 RepID=A0A7X1E7B8_9BACT|nr:fibronectin type III domain-containing protein [Pelagicoccus albus]MBC2604953.1 fibronectin type III domain-containing protein [Pelagicoccus albus]
MQSLKSSESHADRLGEKSIHAKLFRVLSGLFAGVAISSLATAAQLSLSWNDNSNYEDGFEVERALAGGNYELISVVESNQSSYVDSTIVPGLEYEYRVRAFNAFGYSGYTNVSVGSFANTAPSLSSLEDIVVLKGESIPQLSFDFSDAESSADSLVLEAISSDLTFLPLDGLQLELDANTGSITLTPKALSTGSAEVTLLLSDGVEIVQQSFTIEVLRNLAPTISSIATTSAYDGMLVGPIEFSISDAEYAPSELLVSASSTDETLISSESIQISGTGNGRTLSFQTVADNSGTGIIRIGVSDGYNETFGAVRVEISKNKAPEISGFEEFYTVDFDGTLEDVAFMISDFETTASALDIEVTSSNESVVSTSGLRLGGSGASRTLDLLPNSGLSGVTEVTVSVSDGYKTTSETFTLQVLGAEVVVSIVDFTIEERLAVVEVENLPDASFALWKIASLDGDWELVEDAELIADASTTTLIDPSPINSAVCYRVVASM